MRRRILLADDSVTIQKVIELTFLDEDYEVKAVSNGDAAVAALAELRPDFVIADVHMPGANGYEVCRRAKQAYPGVPVLLLVGTFEPFDEGQMRQVGADSYLKKPFDSQELLERVESLLGQGPAAAAPPAAAILSAVPAIPAVAPPPAAAPDPFAAPAFPSELPPLDLPPLSGFGEPPSAPAFSEFSFDPTPAAPPAYAQPPEPTWDFEPSAVPAAPEPFDREPNFNLGPAPAFAVRDEEPIFTFDEPAGEPIPTAEPLAWTSPAAEPTELPPPDEPLTWNPPAPEPAWSPPPPEPAAAPVWPAPVTPPPRVEAAPVWPAPAEPVPAVTAAPVVPATNGGGGLSDDDVDRIARRLVELIGDRAIRDVAWEVVPDLAEVIIRDRLRELEGQAEQL